jgi:hypothetical protein
MFGQPSGGVVMLAGDAFGAAIDAEGHDGELVSFKLRNRAQGVGVRQGVKRETGTAMKRVCSYVLAMTLLVGEARATFVGGNDLHEHCKKVDSSPYSAGVCHGYLAAVADALSVGNTVNGFRVCLPLAINMRQVVDIVEQQLNRNLQQRHHAATGLVAEAPQQAFPCKP